MKKTNKILIYLITMLLCLSLSGCNSNTNNNSNKTTTTVMVYMCGSDLETQNGMGSFNIAEIIKANGSMQDNVAVVLETGGAIDWRSEEILGEDINRDALCRFEIKNNELHPIEEVENANMADPATLSDFIKFAKSNYPADNYVLVLWSHGGGSETGLFLDENFKNDYMMLNELDTALKDGGVHFDTILVDACMMANIETANALKDHANYLVSSEELIPGPGTAYYEWLSYLYNNPSNTGLDLGKKICDTMYAKYNDSSNYNDSLLAFSVIDLSKVNDLVKAFDDFYKDLNKAIRNEDVEIIKSYSLGSWFADDFGQVVKMMSDISMVINYNNTNLDSAKRLTESVEESVVYFVSGTVHEDCGGISFYNNSGASKQVLDVYANNSVSNAYLAMCDAVNSSWDAPSSVYETEEKYDVNDIPAYDVTVNSYVKDGEYYYDVDSPNQIIQYAKLFIAYTDPTNGELVLSGKSEELVDPTSDAAGKLQVPNYSYTLNGEYVYADFFVLEDEFYLFSVPVDIAGKDRNLIGYMVDGDYEISMIIGYCDENKNVALQSVLINDIDTIANSECHILHPIVTPSDISTIIGYYPDEALVINDDLDFEEVTLPSGDYYVLFNLYDIFAREYNAKTVKYYWDGTNGTFSTID